jgi:two-component system, sporulation sensor kinase E
MKVTLVNQDPWFIINSKQHCEFVFNMNPSDVPTPKTILSSEELEQQQEKYAQVISLTKFYMSRLLMFLKGTSTLIAVSDHNGFILDIFGNEKLYNKLQIQPGSLYQEEAMGTNSITLCLTHKQPIQVIGKQHYHNVLHEYSCSSYPFYFPDSKEICGTISIMTEVDKASPFHLGLLSTTVDAIERDLKLQNQNYQLHILNQILINSTQNGIVITDKEGMVTEFNQFAENLVGLKKKQVISKPVTNLHPIGMYINQVLNEGKKYENLEIIFSSNEESDQKICLMDVQPIYDQQRNLIGAYGQFRDITERYQLEQQMIANERLSAIGKLSAGLAHEIRNPLTPLSGFIQLLYKGQKHDEEATRYFNIIFSELERIKDLVNDFVLMAKPETPLMKQCKILPLLQETVLLMNSEAHLKGAQIEIVDHLPHDISIYVDQTQIKQVLINLLQNALEVPSTSNVIEVSLEFEKECEAVKINVKDDGPGMSNEEQSQLFTPFFSTKVNGVGLGLSICERIIKNHNGGIKARSKIGVGTTFEVLLPVSQIS